MTPKCSYMECTADAYTGFEVMRCKNHQLLCDCCHLTANLFSPAGYLCTDHMHQAESIAMNGPYPSHDAVRAVIAMAKAKRNQKWNIEYHKNSCCLRVDECRQCQMIADIEDVEREGRRANW